MPTSTSLFDERIKDWLVLHPYPNYIDVGHGEGRWGVIIKQVIPAARVIGIEIDSEYIETYRLRDIYDEVINARAIDYFANKVSDNFDIVMIMDCIEHMPKSEGTDLLHFLIYRTRFIVLTYPTLYTQGAWQGHISEAHLSTWAHKDFEGWQNEHHVRIGDNNLQHNLVILRGAREL